MTNVTKRWQPVGRQRNKCKIQSVVFLTAIVILAAGMLLSTPVTGLCNEVTRILVVPFKVNAAQDLGFLQRGISDMLVSRLLAKDKVIAIAVGQPGDDITALAAQTQADYVVSGSLTVFGDSVSTDAIVTEVAGNRKVLSFGRAGQRQADAIAHIDQLAAQINAQVLGRKVSPTPAPVAASAPTASVTAPAVEAPDIHQHPEKLLNQDQGAITQGPQPMAIVGPTVSAGFTMRGPKVNGQIQGLATGDIDGDGTEDIITATTSTIVVERFRKGRLVKMAAFDGVGNYVGVDAADLNANGRAEIFVTNFDNSTSKVDAFVLEWDGKALQRTADRLKWYYRAVTWPGRGTILVGQRQGVKERFGAGIHEIVWDNGRYVAGERLPLPHSLNVFGFGLGRVRADEDEEIVAYDPDGYIRILNRRGGEELLTNERYGGSAALMKFPSQVEPDEQDFVYAKPRIHLVDLDGDGIQEILTVKNQRATAALKRLNIFKKGSVECLKWDQLDMVPKWRTRELTKYIADFAVTDLDGDRHPEVIAAVVKKPSGALTKGLSFLAVFKLNLPKSQQAGNMGNN